MNYQRIYDDLIASARQNHGFGYCESHHIVPRCIGGSDDPANLIDLTARQHLVAHLLLAKIHGGRLVHAAWMMTTMKRYNSRQYEWLKVRFSQMQSEKLKKNPINKGWKPTPEQRLAMSRMRLGRATYNPLPVTERFKRTSSKLCRIKSKGGATKGRKMPPMSDEHREKLRQINLGKKQSAETIAKRVKHLIGNQFSKGCSDRKRKHIARLAETARGRKIDPSVVARRWEIRRENQMARKAV